MRHENSKNLNYDGNFQKNYANVVEDCAETKQLDEQACQYTQPEITAQ
jgi:hypothetical protein